MLEVVAIGELLFDIFVLPDGEERVEFGGSPANLCVHLAGAGHRVALCAKVGRDGLPLVGILESFGVDARWISIDDYYPTTRVILCRQPGAPEFEFERGADALLKGDDLAGLELWGVKLVHTTAFALSRPPQREAVLSLLDKAASSGIAISLDANYRPSLWDDPREGRDLVLSLVPRTRWLKLSSHDAEFLLGTREHGEAIPRLAELGAQGICFSTGPSGALIIDGGKELHLPAPEVEVVDPKGAGDALYAGVLHAFLAGLSLEEGAELGLMWTASVLRGWGSLPEGKGVIEGGKTMTASEIQGKRKEEA
jgi:sugar/nucleoside kinase (ribokinase family)